MQKVNIIVRTSIVFAVFVLLSCEKYIQQDAGDPINAILDIAVLDEAGNSIPPTDSTINWWVGGIEFECPAYWYPSSDFPKTVMEVSKGDTIYWWRDIIYLGHTFNEDDNTYDYNYSCDITLSMYYLFRPSPDTTVLLKLEGVSHTIFMGDTNRLKFVVVEFEE